MRAKTHIKVYVGEVLHTTIERVEPIVGVIEWCNTDGSECKDKYNRIIYPETEKDRQEAIKRYSDYQKKLTLEMA